MELLLASTSQATTASDGIFLVLFTLFSLVSTGLMFILPFGGMVIWILALVHVVSHEDIRDRTTWILVVALTGFVGSIIYYFMVKRPYDRGEMRIQPVQNPASTVHHTKK